MNSAAPKYSLASLPDDDWGTRRTKQIIRAVLRAKGGAKITTESLAQACSAYLGEDVKPSTLSGLFAGKRKSIAAHEVEMFAAVLEVAYLDLIFPPGETIESRPGIFASSADALADSLAAQRHQLGAHRFVVMDRAVSCMEIVRLIDEVEVEVVTVLHEIEQSSAPSVGDAVIAQLQAPHGSRMLRSAEVVGWKARQLATRLDLHTRTWNEVGPSVPAGVQLVLDMEEITDDIDDSYMQRVERLVAVAKYFDHVVIGGADLSGVGRADGSPF